MHRTLAAFLLVAAALPARAADDPLRFVPKHADFALRIDSPRKLVDAVIAIEPLLALQKFAAVREALESTNTRRARQFLAYYEKELGLAWPEMLDKLAGGGAVLTGKFGKNQPGLLILQGTDAEVTRKTLKLARGILERELSQREDGGTVETKEYRGVESVKAGNDLYFAQIGSAVAISNKPEPIKLAIDLAQDGPAESLATAKGPAEARKLVPADALATLWVSLEAAQKSDQGKVILAEQKGDIFQLLIGGGFLDVLGRSPFLAAGLTKQKDGMTLTVRTPKGRDASPQGVGLHLAPEGQPGCLPLLEPADVIYSTSFHLDLGTLWTKRETLLTEGVRKELEGADKQFGRFLAGRKMSELLTAAGPYHRFVAVAQAQTGYAKYPEQTIPAFAFVSTVRDPSFPKAMEAVLRATALVAGASYKLKMTDEEINGVKLVCYRFPDTKAMMAPGGDNYVLFNYSPCFAIVGDQFFAASTVELGREMVALLQKSPPSAAPATTLGSQSKVYASGGAAVAKAFAETLTTQFIIDRAISHEDAKREVAGLIEWLRGLGTVSLTGDYRATEFQYDVRWTIK
ncbi:MAG: hypothetical protein U0746_09470 [Gemmataceae bacterium]